MSFTLEPLRRIIKAQGASRVSDGACEALAKALEGEVKALASEAQKIAGHAGRKTITAADVKLARKVVEAGIASAEAPPQQAQQHAQVAGKVPHVPAASEPKKEVK